MKPLDFTGLKFQMSD